MTSVRLLSPFIALRTGGRSNGHKSVPRLAALAAAFAVLFLLGCAQGQQIQQPEVSQTEQGQQIYVRHCQACHGDAATGRNAIPGAPSHGPGGHTWHHADGQLADIILGRLDYPGRRMPSFRGALSEEDVMAVLAYIKTGWLPEQREFQEEASRNWEQLERSP